MKIIIINLLITSILLAKFLPDANTSNNFEIDPLNDTTPKSTFVKYDFNKSKGEDLNASLITNLVNRLGLSKFSKDVNISNEEDLKGYANNLKLHTPSAGNTIAEQLKRKFTDYNSKDTTTFTRKAIVKSEDDINGSSTKLFRNMDDFFKGVRSKMANLKTIDCYVTRKLVNSYYCPLPSMYNSFFKGGNFKDGNDEAKATCENLCYEESSCMHKDMNKDEIVIKTHNIQISNKSDFIINSDLGMMTDYIALDFNIKYKYDDNITTSSNDYNITKAKDGLLNTNHKVRFDISYYNFKLEDYEIFIKGYELPIKDISAQAKVYLSTIKSDKYKITIYEPYLIEQNLTKSDEKLELTLYTSTLKYVDNKYWFCPAKHFIEKISDCDGEVKNIAIGSENKKVCVTESSKQREPVYGAYYTEEQCKSRCQLRANCVPTYRHLGGFDPGTMPEEIKSSFDNINYSDIPSGYDPLNLPNSLKDIEIGCVDNPTNTSCTKELCTELFLEDKMPLVEKSWINDDDIKVTVANGVKIKGKVRPKIDIAGGLSANGSEEDRKKTSLREMTEGSYINMIETNTYDVSLQSIKEVIPTTRAYSNVLNDEGSFAIMGKLKPQSNHYDNNITYNMYAVIAIDIQYRPMYGVYDTGTNGVQSGETDSNIRLIDRIYLLKTTTGYKIIKIKENIQGKFRKKVCKDVETTNDEGDTTISEVCNNEYKFAPITAYEKTIFKTFVGSQYVNYDLNATAEFYNSKKFSSDTRFESVIFFNSLKEIVETPGILFKKQQSISNGRGFIKIYTGEEDTLEKATYMNLRAFNFYSQSNLSYLDLMNNLSNDDIAYSTVSKMPTEIISDGRFGSDKVKFNVYGSYSNYSVTADFKPDSKEEGKKTFIFTLLYDKGKGN